MQPLTVITGILLGSSFAIAFGLAVTWLLLAIHAQEYPRAAAEIETLRASVGLFVLMTVITALSFIGQLKRKPWRWPAQALMWAGLGFIAWFYWPA